MKILEGKAVRCCQECPFCRVKEWFLQVPNAWECTHWELVSKNETIENVKEIYYHCPLPKADKITEIKVTMGYHLREEHTL